jgi:L-asparaginase II
VRGTATVEVWRGAVVESSHQAYVAVADASGRLRASAGDTEVMTLARSAIKPLQVLPLVEDGGLDRFGFGAAEMALACGSHNGEPMHVALAAQMLQRLGVTEESLACGARPPASRTAAKLLRERGERPSRLHNPCSGKHAAMLALARLHGWSFNGYHAPRHPVQERMLAEVVRWTCAAPDDIALATDGCGVPTFGLPLRAWAAAFGRLAAAARRNASPAAVVLRSMTQYPEYVAGTDRLCTALMRQAGGRIAAKLGAEGVYCAAVPGAELGVAIKVADGALRAVEPALIAVLRALGLLSADEVAALARFAEPDVLNSRDERVGSVRAVVELDVAPEVGE